MALNVSLVFLKMLSILPLMSLTFRTCFSEQTSSLSFQCVACDTVMRSPRLHCSLFGSTLYCQHFRSRHFRGPYNCNLNFNTSCLIMLLNCSFGAGLLKVQSVSASLSPIQMLFCHYHPMIVSVCLLREVLCVSFSSDARSA